MSFNSKGAKRWVSTRSPCNEFLIDHLLKLRAVAQKTRNDRKIAVYSSAIESIKRYPLPIICQSQLDTLSGIGDFLAQDLLRAIKKHYRNYLNPFAQRTQNFNSLRQEVSETQKKSISQIGCQTQNNSLCKPGRENLVDVGDDKSIHSVIVPRTYKPKANSNGAYFLMALSRLSLQNIYFTKVQVKEYMRENYTNEDVKSQGFLKLLESNFYVEIDTSNTYWQVKLTQKGRVFATQLLDKRIQNNWKSQLQSKAKQYKIVSQLQREQEPQEKTEQQKRPAVQRQDSLLTLVVDCRQVKDKSDRDYFVQKLRQRFKINCITENIAIGDFLWMLNGQVLDYVIERKKADDLSASIQDGRYKEQKFRLKSSNLSNIIYLYEGQPSTSSALGQRALQSALLKTRFIQKFKVVRTKDINQSIKFLVFMHSQIGRKLTEQEEVFSVGTLQSFNSKNSKSGTLTVETVFGLGIKSFPGIGKGTVSQLTQYFKSYKLMHQKLSQFKTKQDRIMFLQELLKGKRTPNSFFPLLVDFLFSDKYQE